MRRYILKRIGVSLLLIFGVTLTIFGIIRLLPGNPFLFMVNEHTDPAFLEQQLQKIGYYDPLPIQYGKWLLRVLQLDFGYSIAHKLPVTQLIFDRLSNTLLLAVSSFVLSTIISLIIGIASALYPNSVLDNIMTLFSFIGVSIPVFFFALLLIKVFGYNLDILPFSGIETIGASYTGFERLLDIGKHMILPVTTSALTQTAVLMRYTRSALVDTLSEDYIKTAQAKGMTKKQAIIKHGVKNVRVSIITVLMSKLPDLLSGALIVETIFVWPGIGLLNFDAIQKQDYPLIMGITLYITIVVILCNLLSDILCIAVDPRIRYQKET